MRRTAGDSAPRTRRHVQRLGGEFARFAAAVAIFSGTLALSGCGGEAIPEVAVLEGRAVLDPTRESIRMPLDAYQASEQERREVEFANDLLLDDCLQKSGRRYPPASLDRRKLESSVAERTYGVWVIDSVRRWGYGTPPSPLTEAFVAAGAEGTDEDWVSALELCQRDSSLLDMPTRATNSGSAMGDVYRLSAVAASGDERSHAAFDDWHACLRAANIAVPEEGSVTPPGVGDLPEEQQIRVAVADVTCKESTSFVQRLADVEAAYQDAYIEEREAQLVAERNASETALEKARSVIREHGR